MAAPEQIRIYLRNSQEYAQRNRARLNAVVAEQRKSQRDIIISGQNCPYQRLRDRIVTSEDATRALQEGFGDANILKTMMCYNNSLLLFPETSDLKSNFKVRKYLEDLRRIGARSAEGVVLSTTIRPLIRRSPRLARPKPFVVKVPKRQSDNDQIMHEYFVGAYGTNEFRSRIPNFVYTMGLFQCSPPYTNADGTALTYCQNDAPGNRTNYVLYENLTNSRPLKEVVQTCTVQEYINLMSQVVLALDWAYVRKDYTHNDLHSGNVLVRSLPEEVYIEYENGYLPTRAISTIIDQGRAHIVLNGKHYGYEFVAGGVYPDRSYPARDLYKVIMWTLVDAAFGNRNPEVFNGLSDAQINFTNPRVFNAVKGLTRYFYPQVDLQSVAQYLIQARRYYFEFPFNEEWNVRPMDFFNQWLVPLGNPLISAPLHDRIYGCSVYGTCYDLQTAIAEYTEPQRKFDSDPYVFYETLLESVGTSRLPAVLREGDRLYQEHMNKLRNDALFDIDSLQNIVRGVVVLSLTQSAPESIKFSPDYMRRYQDYVNRLVEATDLVTSLEDIRTVMQELNRRSPREAARKVPGKNYTYREVPQRELGNLDQWRRRIEARLVLLKEDLNYVRRLNPNLTVRQYPATAWLFDRFLTLTSALE